MRRCTGAPGRIPGFFSLRTGPVKQNLDSWFLPAEEGADHLLGLGTRGNYLSNVSEQPS